LTGLSTPPPDALFELMAETQPVVAVFDTNIFVRIALGRSRRARNIRQAWMSGRFVVATSESILREVERVMRYPEVQRDYGLTEPEVARFIQLVRATVALTDELYQVEAVAEDSSDNIFLACALEAGADYLVSEDAHLRDLKYYQGVQVIGFDQLDALISEQDLPQS